MDMLWNIYDSSHLFVRFSTKVQVKTFDFLRRKPMVFRTNIKVELSCQISDTMHVNVEPKKQRDLFTKKNKEKKKKQTKGLKSGVFFMENQVYLDLEIKQSLITRKYY